VYKQALHRPTKVGRNWAAVARLRVGTIHRSWIHHKSEPTAPVCSCQDVCQWVDWVGVRNTSALKGF
jgi:hypothetical protein